MFYPHEDGFTYITSVATGQYNAIYLDRYISPSIRWVSVVRVRYKIYVFIIAILYLDLLRLCFGYDILYAGILKEDVCHLYYILATLKIRK